MQTFLPEPNFQSCAAVLDSKRLVKQLLEGRQIMAALAGTTKGWVNHPATRMWKGYEHVFLLYLSHMRNEMDRRGYKTQNNWDEICRIYDQHFSDNEKYVEPPWMKNRMGEFGRVINTHRRALYLKDPIHYDSYKEYCWAFNLVCCKSCNYYWPTHTIGASNESSFT